MKQTIRRLPVVIVITAVLALGLRDDPVPQWFVHQDKLHHVLAFALFAIALGHAWCRMRLPIVLCASLVLGIVIEVAQASMPVRTASTVDVLAGVAGAWLGWCIAQVIEVGSDRDGRG